MAEPKIYTKNYVDSNCEIASNYGGTVARLYDKDSVSKWQTTGADDDATTVILQVDFKEAGVAVSRTIDRVMLLNHNLKSVTFQYYDGSTWQDLLTTQTLDDSVSVISFTEQSTEKFRLLCDETQVADENKYVAELIVCALQLDIGDDMVSYSITHRQKVSEIELLDGSIHRTVIKHSPNRTLKYEARCQFRLLSEATLESLRDIKDAGQAFLWQPESSQRPDEIYLVNWAGSFNYQYSSTYKGAGFNLEMSLKEV